MIKQSLYLILLLLLSTSSYAQLNLRKAILQSDLIISINNHRQDSIWEDSFNSDTSSADYILCNALTSEKFEKYEKRDIMVHLLKVASEW